MKNIKFKPYTAIGYTALTIVTSIISIIALVCFKSLLKADYSQYWILLLLTSLATLLAAFLYVKKMPDALYDYSEDKLYWLKTFLLHILPGEGLKFVISLFSIGNSIFAMYPSMLFESTYAKWADRNAAVFQLGQISFVDVLAYILCYVIYLAVYIAITAIMFYIYWKKEVAADDIHYNA